MDERLGLEDLITAIRESGGRVTSAKRAVAATLADARDHLSADEITRRVQIGQPDVSPSTVYRILEELESLGVVVHSHVGHAAAVYHVVGPAHGHLVCSRCGVTTEIAFDYAERPIETRVRVDAADAQRFKDAGGEAGAVGQAGVQFADGVVATTGYDLVGNKICETDVHGHRSEYAYDPLYRAVKTTLPGVPGPSLGGGAKT